MTKKIVYIGLAVILLLPLVVFGQLTGPGGRGIDISNQSMVVIILTNIFDFLFYIISFLAALFLIYAAYVYLTAAGDAEKVTTAKNIILYAIIAIVIALIAWSLPKLIESILT
mgnify:CR=1 FL=1